MKMGLAMDDLLNITKGSFERARVVIVPFGFEETTTYGRGTKNGPSAIIKAYSQVEAFDEELWQTTDEKLKIAVLKKLYPKTFAEAQKNIKKIIGKILSDKKFPIVLGGEHSITSFIIEEFKKYFDDFSILQFDAHADLRDGYLGKKYSHAAAMRRSLDSLGINLVQIGVRNISIENGELNFWEKNQNRIKTFWAKDKKQWKISEIVGALKKNVYLTFDVDVFDPSIMPSTGTPEPGGLEWYKVLDILRAVAKNKKIIGADFVELAPIKNLHAPDFLVAKLIYKMLGYIFNK
jgi:agmatinase